MNSVAELDLTTKDSWMWNSGPSADEDVVLSTQVLLSRNMRGIPFPSTQNLSQAREVLAKTEIIMAGIESATSRIGQCTPQDDAITQGLFLERGLTDTYLGEMEQWYLDSVQSRFLRINHEDHLEFLGMVPGFDTPGALGQVSSWERQLEQSMGFAASVEMGYLTSKIGLAGTGLRARILFHLPGLSREDGIPVIVQGFPLRPLTLAGQDMRDSHIFILQGSARLGQSEQEFLESFSDNAFEIIHQERQARERFRDLSPLEFDDQSWRSWGGLLFHRILGWQEFLSLWSRCRMAWGMKVLPDFPYRLAGLPLRLGNFHMKQWLRIQDSPVVQDLEEKDSPNMKKMTILDEARSLLVRKTFAGGM